MEELRIGIVGSRRRKSLKDYSIVAEIIRTAVEKNPDKKIIIVSGACPEGADDFAATITKATLGEGHLKEFPIPKDPPITARWEFTKRAHARNRQIAEYCHVLFALVAADRTGGTESTIRHAHALEKKVYLVDEDGRIYLSPDGKEPNQA